MGIYSQTITDLKAKAKAKAKAKVIVIKIHLPTILIIYFTRTAATTTILGLSILLIIYSLIAILPISLITMLLMLPLLPTPILTIFLIKAQTTMFQTQTPTTYQETSLVGPIKIQAIRRVTYSQMKNHINIKTISNRRVNQKRVYLWYKN